MGRLASLVELGLDGLEVGVDQLELEDPQRLDRFGGTGDVAVGERPQHVDDGVDLADPGQELVAEALTLGRALDQPADVHELDRSGHGASGGAHLAQLVEAVVRHLGHPDVGVGRGEGIGGRQRGAAGQRVVERRLPRVGQADESESLHVPPRVRSTEEIRELAEANADEPRGFPVSDTRFIFACGSRLEA